jgi:phosphatidylglycerol:prolipoprotein diacylglycerol transferase
MLQELFRIPGIDHPVYGYGLMMVIGFLCGAALAKYLARRFGYDGDVFVNATLLALLAGVLGARLSHILEDVLAGGTEFANNGKSAWDNFKAMLNVSSGGLTFYGGFLLATPVLILYAIWKKVPLLRGMDIIAPALMVGLAFGRIGCFLNGCCYGEECSLSWGASFPYGSNAFVEQYEKGEIPVPPELTNPAARYPNGRPSLITRQQIRSDIKMLESGQHRLTRDEATREIARRHELERLMGTLRAKPVHPTELYSAFNAFFIVAVCLAYLTLNPAPGRVFALMLILKGTSRFIMEMIRVEPPVWGPLSFSMVISIGLLAAGILMWVSVPRLLNRGRLEGFPVMPKPA